MANTSYLQRRDQIETYFDRTAAQAWERLTSTAPVGRIRATVRAGRDQMRGTLLSWLPQDMSGLRLLDAGCGTGALAMEAAQRGAEVVATDLSPTLVQLARERHLETLARERHLETLARERSSETQATGRQPPPSAARGSIHFTSGDMLDESLGQFDHVVAMDSLIHYDTPDIVAALERLALRTRGSLLFTFAPRTPLLAAMHSVGRLFPRSDRSPSLSPVSQQRLGHGLQHRLGAHGWQAGRCQRVASGFYTSQAWEWKR